MPQIKVVLKETEFSFVNSYAKHGFTSKTELVNEAVALLRKKLRENAISRSAEIYQEIYESDKELQELTDDATGVCLD